jgi:hypothetical protein
MSNSQMQINVRMSPKCSETLLQLARKFHLCEKHLGGRERYGFGWRLTTRRNGMLFPWGNPKTKTENGY